MVPIRLVTRNRWFTLIWAAGMCLTAYRVAGPDASEAVASVPASHGEAVAATPAGSGDKDDLGAAVEALNRRR